jgi:hypothetical protein
VLIVKPNKSKPESGFRQVIVPEIRSHSQKVEDGRIFRRSDGGQFQVVLVLDGGTASFARRD